MTLEKLTDPSEIAASKPANLWLSQLDFSWADDPALYREHFLRHCGFFHQQASVFMRTSRTEAQWADIIDRMQMYGAMASEDLADNLPAGIAGHNPDVFRWAESVSLPVDFYMCAYYNSAHRDQRGVERPVALSEWPNVQWCGHGDRWSQMTRSAQPIPGVDRTRGWPRAQAAWPPARAWPLASRVGGVIRRW